MKKVYLIIIAITLAALAFYIHQDLSQQIDEETLTATIKQFNMKLTSPAFVQGGKIPAKYTCDGENINPPLAISGVPLTAKSLVLIMEDPDAIKPAGKIWDHWVVYNMSPEISSIREGQQPLGDWGVGTNNSQKYSGPCPPDGEHRYFFKLYAVDTRLDLKLGATKQTVLQAVQGHTIETAELVGTYNRQ